MSLLIDWHVADRVFDFSLIVALGVTLLSGAAWTVSWLLRRKPAIRHLVLLSALICCLAIPVLAAVCIASGLTLISIPLLPAGAERDVVRIPSASARGDHLERRLQSQSFGFAGSESDQKAIGPSEVATTDRTVRKPAKPFVKNPTLTQTRVESERPQAGDRAGSPAPYRVAATLLLMLWGCGSLRLLLPPIAKLFGTTHALSLVEPASRRFTPPRTGRRLPCARPPTTSSGRRLANAQRCRSQPVSCSRLSSCRSD